MDFNYSKKGKNKFSMANYAKNVVLEFPKVIKPMAAMPALDHLFQVKEDLQHWCLNKDILHHL